MPKAALGILVAALSVLVVTACSRSDEGSGSSDRGTASQQADQPVATPQPAPAKQPAPGAKAGEQPAPGAKTGEQPGTKAAKQPAKELSLADRAKTTQPVTPTPAPQTLGSSTLAAERCSFDGTEMLGESAFKAIGPIAVATDGTIYVIDHEQQVRRYRAAKGTGCVLQLDTSFGEGGVLNLGQGLGRGPEGIAADTRGHIFVSSGMSGSWRITGNKVDYHCEVTRGEVSVDPTGTVGVALFGSSNPKKVSYTDTGCTQEPLKLQDPFDSLDAIGFVGKRLFVGGAKEIKGSRVHLVREYNINGQPVGQPLGSPGSGDDHLCNVGGFPACSHGVCVLDTNCRRIRAWGSKGNFIGQANLMKLLGLRYPWISGFTPAVKGVAFASASQERGQQTRVYEGLIYRVKGM